MESNIGQKLYKSETGFLPNTVAFSVAHDSSRLLFSWNFLEISRKLWRKILRWQATVSRRKSLWRKLCSSRWPSDPRYTPNSYDWTNDLRFQKNSEELTIDLSYTDKSTSQSRCSFWRFCYTDYDDRWTRICLNSWELWNPEILHMIWCIDKLFLEKTLAQSRISFHLLVFLKKKYSVNFELLIMTKKYFKKMLALISINNLDLMHFCLNNYKVTNVLKTNHDRNNLFITLLHCGVMDSVLFISLYIILSKGSNKLFLANLWLLWKMIHIFNKNKPMFA